MLNDRRTHWAGRLPFYFGWVIIAVAFVTMAVGVTARTAFSLLMPPLIDEFGWDRGLAAGAFSFGFFISAVLSPLIGRLMDRFGPRAVILTGCALLVAGLFLAPLMRLAWHLYVTMGLLVGAGANMMTYSVHSQFLPNWFLKRRALAIGIAFAGAGVGAILLLPWLQTIILTQGWRASCYAVGLLVLLLIVPLTLLVCRRPEDIGLAPDGVSHTAVGTAAQRASYSVVDPAWTSVEWTLARAMRTSRFWLIAVAYFGCTVAWYAVQVHQTKYLTQTGFSPVLAAWALGFVSIFGVPGQILLGALSDRVGREWVWSIGCAGFVICYGALIALEHTPSLMLLWVMVVAQGFLGYAVTSVMGPIVVEIFEGPHYGTIFGTVTVALMAGGAVGPWMAGAIYDATGSYRWAFVLAIVGCIVSAAAIWLAAPRKVRLVPGRLRRSDPGQGT